MSSTWDEMRRKARLLENEIDTKLVSLNKISSSTAAQSYSLDQKKSASKRAVFESLSGDIENLISKLTRSNSEMKEYVDLNLSQYNGSTLEHTVRRHREILRDYCTEFNRASANIKTQIDREDLLSGGIRETDPSVINNRGRTSDYLLRENDRINNCDRSVDESISIAMSVKENLHSQKSALGVIGKKIQQLARKYPAINSVMQKIRVKKRKDTLILAAVISSCLIFFFIYVMH